MLSFKHDAVDISIIVILVQVLKGSVRIEATFRSVRDGNTEFWNENRDTRHYVGGTERVHSNESYLPKADDSLPSDRFTQSATRCMIY
jgi:hypothetical protein